MTHAHCILDDRVFKPTLRICNTYGFAMTEILRLMRFSVTLYLHLPALFFIFDVCAKGLLIVECLDV